MDFVGFFRCQIVDNQSLNSEAKEQAQCNAPVGHWYKTLCLGELELSHAAITGELEMLDSDHAMEKD